MLADNPLLIDLGLVDTLKLLRHRRHRPGRVKGLTPDEAQELLLINPTRAPAADHANHDATGLLPLSAYRILCCPVAELGAKAGLHPDSLDLAFADAPWDQASLGMYGDIGNFARNYLKPGRPLLSYAGVLNLPDNIERLKAEGLAYLTTFAIQFPSMCKQPTLGGLRLRNGWRPIIVMTKGVYQARYWVDDSQDGMGPEKAEDRHQANALEIMYWIHHLTMPGDLVASLCGGVFTEAVACRRLGRRFVGCDPSERKCQVGRERLEEVSAVHRGALYTRWRG
jgi:hypothetical protein